MIICKTEMQFWKKQLYTCKIKLSNNFRQLKTLFMKKYLFSILAFICLSGIETAIAQSNYNSDSLHLRVKRMNDTYIDAYVAHPSGSKKVPLLIICQGTGADCMVEAFLGITEQWKDSMGRMVIEKPGVKLGDDGKTISAEYKEYNAVYNRFYDYLRMLQYLKPRAGWWDGNVYVIGGSEGGLLAGMLASYYPNVKAAAILSFGGGLNFGEAWPQAIAYQNKLEGKSEKQINLAVKKANDSLQIARNNPTNKKSYEGEDNTYMWWASITDLRLVNTLTDLDIPVLLVHGTEDIMMPVVSAQKLNDAFSKKGKTNLEYKEYADYDHGYTDKEGKSHYAAVFIDAIKWMWNRN
jgi:pimeloyl-ACP methyl ester carboxylesterase